MKKHLKTVLMLLLSLLVAAGLWYTHKSVVRALDDGAWSDPIHQWKTCQYIKAGVNPYELGFRLLRDTFGPATGPNRILLKEVRIYSTSTANWRNAPGLLPGLPPPEATYPPSTMSMLVPAIGFLSPSALLPVCTTANIFFLILLIALLSRWFRRETGLPTVLSLGLVTALCLLWPPLQLSLEYGQVSILSFLCMLTAIILLNRDRLPLIAGMLFMVSLIKPSLVLLFFFIPLLQLKWKPIGTAFCLGIFLTLLPSLWLHEWPWVLLSQWMGLCRYLLQGSFTLQEVLNAIAWENTLQGMLVVFLVWGTVLWWCARYRRARWEEHFAFLCLANLSWTYHERPDFVLIVFLLVLFASKLIQSAKRKAAVLGLGFCLILGLALSDTCYVPAVPWAHAIRWAGRLSILGLWGVCAVGVRNSHHENTAASLPV